MLSVKNNLITAAAGSRKTTFIVRDALGNAIVGILGDGKKAQRFGENGILLVHERFDWQKIAQKVEQIYNRCTKKSNSTSKALHTK